jgi:hypothetical protein
VTRIDHVLLATTELDHGSGQLWRGYGLRCAPGGRHVAWGAANLIIPVGDQYLELVAVTDPELAAASPLGRAVLAGADRDRITPIGVCLVAPDLDHISQRLGSPRETGARVLADGAEIRWTTVGLARAFGAERLPFYINWDALARHPRQARSGTGSLPGKSLRLRWAGRSSSWPSTWRERSRASDPWAELPGSAQ